RDEAARAAPGEPDRGEPRLLQPLGIGSEPVLLLHLLGGEIIERPHPLVGVRGEREREGGQHGESLHRLFSWKAARLFASGAPRGQAFTARGIADPPGEPQGGATPASTLPRRANSSASSGS